MGQPSTPRKRADEYLMAAPGDGWVPREDVLRVAMRFVMPGVAHRKAAQQREAKARSRRANGQESDCRPSPERQQDALLVGSRMVATTVLSNAARHGAWQRDGDLFRHRDHPAAVAERDTAGQSEPAPRPDGWQVPGMDRVRGDLDAADRLAGFTKWHWAAIILANVEPQGRPGRIANGKSPIYTPLQFAAFGLPGLSDHKTVTKYHRIALAHWGRRLEPGERVEIPGMDTWPRATPADVRPPRPPRPPIDDLDGVLAAFLDYYGDAAEAKVQQLLAEVRKQVRGRKRTKFTVVH